MTSARYIPDKARSRFSHLWERLDKRLPPKAFFLLIAVILVLSGVATIDFSARQSLLTEGQIAPVDVVADSTFLFRDRQATQARRDLARKMQPLVLDLVAVPADTLRGRLQDIFLSLNEALSPERKEEVRTQLSEEFGIDFSATAFNSLSSASVQKAVLGPLLFLAEQRLKSGVLPDLALVQNYPGGFLVRNVATGEESLHHEAAEMLDVRGLEVQLSQQIKELNFSNQGKHALSMIIGSLLRPSLVPNYDATSALAERMAEAVDPVVYRVLRGEMIVQKGDRVSREQQVKMQMLLQRQSERFRLKSFLGYALCGALMSLGLLFSPSGKPSSPMRNKDFIFLSVLLTLFALLSKGLAGHGAQIAEISASFLPESLAFAVPVAGAAALAAQIFSARRYLVTGLLIAFFCTIMMDGGLSIFIFYFLATMWSTWLTNRSTSRRDVVWSLLPLSAGLLALWAAATLIQGGAHNRYFAEIMALLLGGSFLSMLLAFALAPVVEMVFGYTTRFRLMELLNVEQPLLRDLMIKAPGTYHHSLIVSNMCEAGAKRVGAHSLLCKVAALYHDIGKVTKADYFIENQMTEDNPHDRLAPSMSALILISHVKQGVELAMLHRLGQEVTDIIRQHHGTSIIQYFYRKAMNMEDAPPPNIEDFRYPGPKPQSREAALVMLADIVEASSRTLADPSPTRLRQHIDDIMKSIYSAGQLDESELTFKDLHELADSFQHVLRGLFHHRIAYPAGAGSGQSKPRAAKALHLDPGQGENGRALPPAETPSISQ